MPNEPLIQESKIVTPGHSLGQICLGASIHEVLNLLKDQRSFYPAIDLHHSQTEPLITPVVILLPENGLRLRFDGADQRLRLIEILDFRKIKLVYKGSELHKGDDEKGQTSGPHFKRIYQIFGASYPGEFLPPKERGLPGTYILSWPGVAFNFPLQHSAWSPDKDHVSLLGSVAAGPASHMAIFEGNSWTEARHDLFIRSPDGPRMSALTARPKDSLPGEIELAHIGLNGHIELERRDTPAFNIVINETQLQDLLTELGPPDATHKRDERVDTAENSSGGAFNKTVANGRAYSGSQPSSYSSTGTDTFDTDFDSGDLEEDSAERACRERFWCYFDHGMDILVGPYSGTEPEGRGRDTKATTQLVVQKVIIHGNVPGSYAFNRHRRLRWTLGLSAHTTVLSSEDSFDPVLKPALVKHFAPTWPESEMTRGKVVNRTWGASPSDSNFFLPDAGEDLVEGTGSEQWLGNTKLYSFPGFVFEVTDNGAVSALTVN